MTGKLSLALIASALVAGASGCIVEHDVIPDRAPVPAAPPAPSEEAEASPPPAPSAEVQADVPAPGAEVEESVFYERLTPYGHWRWDPDYGRVWVPTVAYGWRPYTYGRWVLTDYGWTFVSDDPFGWAAYHYGSWAFGPALGWYWVPGRVWAPAWVSWRWGSGYACWSPIGPAGYVYGYGSPAWVVVPQQHFTQPIVANAIAPRAAGPIVSHAQPLAGPHASPARGSQQFGPPVAQVQQAVGHPIAPVQARAVIGPQAQRPPGFAAGAAGPRTSSPGAHAGSPAATDPMRSPRPQPGSPAASGGSRYGVSNLGPPRTPPSARPRDDWRASARPGAPGTSGGQRSPARPSSSGKPWSGAATRPGSAVNPGAGRAYGGGSQSYGGGQTYGGGRSYGGGTSHAGGAAAPAGGGGGHGGSPSGGSAPSGGGSSHSTHGDHH